ncbi:MAG: hypothetical protein JW987_05200 [Anaerolineaceae bacterium]|nr:hypothetical protein [Anaerolineaceae bacterium]
MSTLRALAQSAMLGTGNGFTPPMVDGVSLSASDLEGAVLAAAAALGAAQMGGVIAQVVTEQRVPCASETLRPLPDRAVALLKRVLEEENAFLLPEFLTQIAARKMCVPPETVPTLLGLGKSELRPLVVKVSGACGRWLAESNSSWAYALGREAQDAWEHGTRLERLAALEEIRGQDPATASAWLEASWQSEPPEERAAFVRVLQLGLSMADEPFLEACLDDKRKEVREAARRLLVGLEESRFAQRMWERARPLVDLKSRFLMGDRLEAHLPEGLDAAAKGDGLGGVALRKDMGEKANLLAQMVALIAPSRWSQEFNRTPEKLLAAAMGCEWKEPLVLGWQLAARAVEDVGWAEALVDFWIMNSQASKILDGECLDELILMLPAEKMERLAVGAIKPVVQELDEKGRLMAVLKKYQRPWSKKLALAVIRSAQRQAGGSGYYLPAALPEFARYVPIDLADELSAGWPGNLKGYWETHVERFLQVLNSRSEMIQILAE